MESDIVYIWFADYPALPFIVLAKAFGKPVVTNVGGWEVYAASDIGYGNQLNPVRGWATRFILRNSTACICMSNAYKTIIETVEPCSKVAVIPGWVDSDLCTAPLPEKHGVVTAICTRTFTSDLKGIPTFIKATTGMDATVIVHIPRERLLEKFKSAKVYCQLSRTESFGMSLLESMACGCVPVVSDKDALPEVVGGCGLIVPYGDVEQTRLAIKSALGSGTADIEDVRKRASTFTRERKKESVIKLLEGLCKTKK
jgi:glycosyltransferase involved in cell wall biosynthesis